MDDVRVWTIIASAVSLFLLAGLFAVLFSPGEKMNGLTLVLYLGVLAGLVWGGWKLDHRKAKG